MFVLTDANRLSDKRHKIDVICKRDFVDYRDFYLDLLY